MRGFIEDVARARPDLARGQWIDHVGLVDTIHRNFALAVVAAAIGLAVWLRRAIPDRVGARRAADAAATLAMAQFVVGGILVTLALPRAMQVIHLLFGALLLGALTAAAMLARRR